MRDGQAGLGHPPWRGGWGVASNGGVEGSERPDSGCLGEYGTKPMMEAIVLEPLIQWHLTEILTLFQTIS